MAKLNKDTELMSQFMFGKTIDGTLVVRRKVNKGFKYYKPDNFFVLKHFKVSIRHGISYLEGFAEIFWKKPKDVLWLTLDEYLVLED